MSAERKCRTCGIAVPANAPFGHCPKCLLELGFGPLHEVSTTPGNHRVFGDYELLEEIGRGGMGVVYKARQTTLNRLVALKMIKPGEAASPILIDRFRMEAEAAANLHHPNIVPIYETGEFQGQPFFSMALIDGVGLDQYISRDGFCFGSTQPGPECDEQIARVMAKVVRAVDEAHRHAVLHRDLKPSNIILDDRGGEPHLTDFGVAKVIGHAGSSLTASGAIMGTPSYMAPEQAAGGSKRVSTSADIYSLGAILYEMLTGHPPFRGDTPVETLKQVVEREPKHPTAIKESVDRDLATICMRCLEKEPRRRYTSAAALAEDLERWLRNEPILARPVGAVGRLVRWCRREPKVALLVGGIAVSLIVITIAALTAFGHAQRAAQLAEDNRKQTDAHNRVLRRVAEQFVAKQLEELNRFYQNPTQTLVIIRSEELAMLIGRPPPENDPRQPPTRLTVGVYTHTSPSKMFTRFAPVISYIETNLGAHNVRIDLVIYKGYSNLVSALIGGAVDLARPGPASYILARRSNPSLIPVLKQLHAGDPIIKGVIFTRPESGIETLEALKRKSFAFGDRDSTFGNYVSKDALFEAGLHAADLQWVHLANHEEVVQGVMDGKIHAGAANANVVERLGGGKLRIIQRMQSVSFPWVATTNLPPHLRERLINCLLSLKNPTILGRIDDDLTGFMLVHPEDYDELDRKMSIAAVFEGESASARTQTSRQQPTTPRDDPPASRP
jgi:phosphate/phosphite/phosphonate ABC transporter binding protein